MEGISWEAKESGGCLLRRRDVSDSPRGALPSQTAPNRAFFRSLVALPRSIPPVPKSGMVELVCEILDG